MPDITMCGDNACPMRRECYRSPWAGTQPSDYQSWFFISPRKGDTCDELWPAIAESCVVPGCERPRRHGHLVCRWHLDYLTGDIE